MVRLFCICILLWLKTFLVVSSLLELLARLLDLPFALFRCWSLSIECRYWWKRLLLLLYHFEQLFICWLLGLFHSCFVVHHIWLDLVIYSHLIILLTTLFSELGPSRHSCNFYSVALQSQRWLLLAWLPFLRAVSIILILHDLIGVFLIVFFISMILRFRDFRLSSGLASLVLRVLLVFKSLRKALIALMLVFFFKYRDTYIKTLRDSSWLAAIVDGAFGSNRCDWCLIFGFE